ncbi:glycosyltransferase family 2 protein [soil metagenome]
MARPLVTIGVSTYNRADGYLQNALESALAQTYPNLEIVVSDNGSSDGTEAYVKSFGDERIRYFKQAQNIGANANFNFCLDQARGDYFLLLHDDDVLDPDLVESCLNAAADDTRVGVLRSGTRVIDGAGKVLTEKPNRMGGHSTTELFLSWFDKGTAIYFCSTLFNTRRLREAGGLRTKTNVFEDVVAIARLAARYGHADVLEPKASFRIHGANKGSSVNTVRDWAEDSLYLLQVLREELPRDADTLVAAGRPYLCARLYRYASLLPSWRERLQAYVWSYRLFDYSYSPLSYLSKQQVTRLKDGLRTRVKGRPSGQAA